jgi:hypothetical protein
MPRGLVLAALLLPLSGCYDQSAGYPPPGYAQPGYAPPGYAPPGYAGPGYGQPSYPPPPGYPPGYGYAAPAGYDPYGNVYPGYSDNGGEPTLLVAGAVTPLILFDGGWGYWDSRHNWHRAPDEISRHLEQQRASGAGFRHGGGDFGRPGFGGGAPPGDPSRGQFPRPGGPGRPAPGADPAHGQIQRPAGLGAGPGRPAAIPAAAARPAPAAAPNSESGHPGRDRAHDCPPGQRC